MWKKYPNTNPDHQRDGNKEDKNRKKGEDPKSEDKDSNATGTVGAHY